MGMSSGGGNTMADINITPLVDVMLVLLIIFMVTAPMLNSAGVEIDLPKEQAPALNQEEDQLILAIDENLKTYIDDKEFPREDLAKKLAAIAKANPELPVFLRASGEVPYREVANLLSAAKDAGMPRVGLVFDPSAPSEE